MSFEAFAGILVFLATGLLACFTWQMARAASAQVDDRRKELEEARRPAIFMKDLWVKAEPKDAGRLKFQFVSKGIANLGAFALAIHYLEVHDANGNVLANSHPMTVIPAGQAIGANEAPLFEPVRAWPDRDLSAAALHELAQTLVITFRSGTMPNAVNTVQLKRVDTPNRWLNFRNESSDPSQFPIAD